MCEEKLFGVYYYDIYKLFYFLLCGFDDCFFVLYFCYVDFDVEFLVEYIDFDILVMFDVVGVYFVVIKDKCNVFVIGYFEYDVYILYGEYVCDLGEGFNFVIFVNYYFNDNLDNKFCVSWCSYGYLLFVNWFNYCVY